MRGMLVQGELLIQCNWCPEKRGKFGHKRTHRTPGKMEAEIG